MAVLDWVWDVSCVVCRRRGAPLCESCLAEVVGSGPAIRQVDGLDVVSLGVYAGALGTLIRAAKRGQSPAAIAEVAGAVRALARAEATVVVPMPSSLAGFRQRGWSLATRIARMIPVRTCHALSFANPRTQRGRGKLARWQGREMAVRGAERLRCESVLLVDDVCTTGATLTAARDALSLAGVTVVGALVLASVAP